MPWQLLTDKPKNVQTQGTPIFVGTLCVWWFSLLVHHDDAYIINCQAV